ncbi:MAG: toll/interleukin-1 receptor domain-containing protein [Pirellulales bacterium]|nr:toll/interleukin-1 receptor domain-containing protein [Pirellulales bacterium]
MKKSGKKTGGIGSGKSKSAPYQVFISHATADKWIAKVLCEKIEATGAKTFRDDRDINGGDDIPDQIRRQIIRSNEMIVLLTPESVDRLWVHWEVGAAWGRRSNARIVAILCHVSVDTIPNIIGSKKAVSINSFNDYLEALKKRLEKYC